MFFWFVGTAWVSVWFVFRDERFDYRMLAVGSLLPDAVDILTGGAWVFHSVTASIIVLAAVMVATGRRGAARRSMLAVTIGMFMHLVFDGVFTRTDTFWWPFSGLSFGGAPLPSLDRLPLSLVMEAAGIGMIAWMGKMHGLGSRSARRRLLRTGELVPVRAGSGSAGTC